MHRDNAPKLIAAAATILLTQLNPPPLGAASPPHQPTQLLTAFDCDAQRLIFYDHNQARTIGSTPILKPEGQGHFTTLHDLNPVPGQQQLVFSSPDDAARQAATMNIYRLDLRTGASAHITGTPLAPADHRMIRIKGRALDSRGYAIEAMRISAIRTNNQTLTDSDGWFVIEVPEGHVHLLATLDTPGEDTFGELELLHQEDDIDDAAIAVYGRADERVGFALATPSLDGQHIYMSQSGLVRGPSTLLDYDTHTGTLTPLLPAQELSVHQLAISPDGQRLLLSEHGALSLLELNDLSYQQLLAHDGEPSAAWLNDTQIGMTGLDQHATALLDLETQRRSNITLPASSPATQGQRLHGFSQDGRWMFIRAHERDWMIDLAHDGDAPTRTIKPLDLDCDPDQAGLQRCEHLCAIAPPTQLNPKALAGALFIEDITPQITQDADTTTPADLADPNDVGCTTSPFRRSPAPSSLLASIAMAMALGRRRRSKRSSA